MRFEKFIVLSCILSLLLTGCTVENKSDEAKSDAAAYGVYLSSEYDTLPDNVSCETLVIDAQYYTGEEIDKLHEDNEKIYSYINVGAIETFRDYYEDFTDILLGEYENWPEESFIDVSQERWQNFILNSLAPEVLAKGVDGFFLDNADVYYEYPSEEIFDGITNILTGLKNTDSDVVVNGGDVYVTEYLQRNKQLSAVIDAVNQEFVFSSIDWEDETFSENEEDSKQYYLDYLEKVNAAGIDVYLLEYTRDAALSKKIKAECASLGYTVYVSDSLELD